MTAWSTHGWGGPWFLLFPLFWLGIVVTVAFVLRRRWTSQARGRAGEDVLGERYARGEITDQEYRERMNVLRDASR